MKVNTEKAVIYPQRIVDQLICETDAVFNAFMLRREKMTHEDISKRLSIARSTVTRILDGQLAIPKNRRVDFMELVGNILPIQFEAAQFGCVVIDATELERMKKEGTTKPNIELS